MRTILDKTWHVDTYIYRYIFIYTYTHMYVHVDTHKKTKEAQIWSFCPLIIRGHWPLAFATLLCVFRFKFRSCKRSLIEQNESRVYSHDDVDEKVERGVESDERVRYPVDDVQPIRPNLPTAQNALSPSSPTLSQNKLECLSLPKLSNEIRSRRFRPCWLISG